MLLHFKRYFFLRFKCKRCVNNIQIQTPPENSDCTSDLSQWYHCSNYKGVPDTVLAQSWEVTKAVSFVFHHRSNNATVQPASPKSNDNDNEDDDEDEDENSKKKKKSKLWEDCDDDYEDNYDEDYIP